MKQALVVGGLGVVGQGIVQRLGGDPEWTVYAASRCRPQEPGTAT